METVGRLVSLAKEMKIEVGCLALVVNGVRGQQIPVVEQMAEGMIQCKAFTVPFSDDLANLNAEGRSLLELGESDHVFRAVKAMSDQLIHFV